MNRLQLKLSFCNHITCSLMAYYVVHSNLHLQYSEENECKQVSSRERLNEKQRHRGRDRWMLAKCYIISKGILFLCKLGSKTFLVLSPKPKYPHILFILCYFALVFIYFFHIIRYGLCLVFPQQLVQSHDDFIVCLEQKAPGYETGAAPSPQWFNEDKTAFQSPS